MLTSLRAVSGKASRLGISSGTLTIGLGGRTGAHRARLYLAAIDERDWRIEDHTLASSQSGVYFHPRAQVARDFYTADLGFTVFDPCRLHAAADEDEGLCRNEGRQGIARCP